MKARASLLVLAVGLSLATFGFGGSAAALKASLDEVKVSGAQPAEPHLTLRRPFSVATTTRRVIDAGTGPVASAGQRVTFRFLMVDGRTGKAIPTDYGWNPANTLLEPDATDHLFIDAFAGTAVGSRLLVAASPKEPYVKNMVGGKGVKRGDTVLFVLDLVDAHTPLTTATGTPGTSALPGLPTVVDNADGAPTVAVPPGTPPADLESATLIQGDGPKLDVGQNALVNYEGVIWRTGHVFDSTWKSGKPLQAPLGVGQVMTGWDNGLIGQTVGSRVLLVVPPSQGFGTQGNSRLGVRSDDTLVFVIDILDAWT